MRSDCGAGRMHVHGERPAPQSKRSEARDAVEEVGRGLTACPDSRSHPLCPFWCQPWLSKSLAENNSKDLRKKQQNSETRVRKVLRQDLYRPPRLPSAACGWRLLTVVVWRRCMRRRTRGSPPDVRKRRILSPEGATRTGERFWMLCKELYR